MIHEGLKYAFVHIPRTAGWSICEALPHDGQPRCGWHCSRGEYGSLEGFYVFTVVRNPWDRLVSLNHYMFDRYGGPQPMPHFLEQLQQQNLDRTSAVEPTQSRFLDGPFSRILRYESLLLEWPILLAEMGLEWRELPRHHVSKVRFPYRDYYDRASRERVGEICAEEIRRFGWEF
jgi:hypothetical protein